MFECEASEWELTYRKLADGQCLWSQFPEIEDFLPLLRREGAKRILDAGCGDGKNLAALLREPSLFCIGCDSARTALEICEREIHMRNEELLAQGRISQERLKELCLVASLLEDLPFLDNYFDAAVCVDVINHNREPYRIFSELERVLKPRGLLYLSLFNVNDEILQDPSYSQSMKPINGRFPQREFEYDYVNGDGDSVVYYFRFLCLDEVENFLEATQLEVLDKRVKQWQNPPHPHFRPYEHIHSNIMVMARNAKPEQKGS